MHGDIPARIFYLSLGDCHYYRPRCQPSEFNCKCEDDARGDSRECKPQSWVCDGQPDCSNGADEIDCRCDPGEYQCYDGVGVRFYQCINDSRVCNEAWDCVNQRDEYEKCRGGFQCNNGVYKLVDIFCNQFADPNDYSFSYYENNFAWIDGCQQRRCDCFKEGNDTCVDGIRCYRDWDKCNRYANCEDGSDEWNCPTCLMMEQIPCACNKVDDYSCKGKGSLCYKHDDKCNGYAQCPDGSDEWNCSSCPSTQALRCTCNKIDDYSCKGSVGRVCYKDNERCDTRKDCADSSDEMNCYCPEDKFTCSCFRKNFPICNMTKGCISMKYVNDGKFDCDSGNDEEYIKSWDKMIWGSCNFDVLRLENQSFSIPPWCDNSTCTNVPSLECSKHDCNMTDAVCFSFCSDKKTSVSNAIRIFQCTNQSIILDQNFCNGKEDCNDGSDEITFQSGFKCSAKLSTIRCVLPQWNLYDDKPQCYDNSDLCFSSDGSFHCFKCLDNRLIISPKQVCDGVIDCFDLSDECLCENPSLPQCLDVFSRSSQCNFLKFWKMESNDASNTLPSLRVGKDLMTCKNKQGDTLTVQCDGRPECLDFSDECKSCLNTPAFCNDTCRTYYPMGDRYCDGYIDEAWKYLKDTNCSKGFDEKNCPKRFQCKAGGRISIDILQQCDGKIDCDDGIDEKDCFNRYYCTTKLGNLISIPKTSVLNGKQDCVDGSDEYSQLFSSALNLIDSLDLKIWLWLVTILTIFGNGYVAAMSIQKYRRKRSPDASVSNHILITNLAVSDCLMGVYLLIILLKDIQYTGNFIYQAIFNFSLCSLDSP
ncbi:unnamed protein product [Clavelina lepadiformis]|uniref:G-protein coupled receptor GRL101-like protein n=1 Tax=Clavelina lepadiformis TaxID=159417 RepID=A0ABP0G2I6_CLALP